MTDFLTSSSCFIPLPCVSESLHQLVMMIINRSPLAYKILCFQQPSSLPNRVGRLGENKNTIEKVTNKNHSKCATLSSSIHVLLSAFLAKMLQKATITLYGVRNKVLDVRVILLRY